MTDYECSDISYENKSEERPYGRFTSHDGNEKNFNRERGRSQGFERGPGRFNRSSDSRRFNGDRKFKTNRPPQSNYEPQDPSKDEEMFKSGICRGIDFDAYDKIPIEVTGGSHLYSPVIDFTNNSGISPQIVTNINKSNYKNPTPIQKHSISILLHDKCDIMACAQTGSGKTAAFIIPTFTKLLNEKEFLHQPQSIPSPLILIIGPTRELVTQIWGEMKKFSFNTGIQTAVIYGGVSHNYVLRQMNMGCHAMAATPGRLTDFSNRGLVDLSKVRYLILDEADRMLDMGFIEPIRQIINCFGMSDVGIRRTCMFSATFPWEIQMLAREMLTEDYFFITIGAIGAAANTISQEFEMVPIQEKRGKMIEILKNNPSQKILIFVETKRIADYLAVFLLQSDVKATSIHGDRTQEQRETALYDFKRGTHNVLLATGVAARGLDIPDVEIVLNYDFPSSIEEYVHRIGRTGRVGHHGRAISFLQLDKDEKMATQIIKLLRDSNLEVPQWLTELTCSGEGSSYHIGKAGGNRFVSRDTRYPQKNSYQANHYDRNRHSNYEQENEDSTFPAAAAWTKNDGEAYLQENWD